MANAGCHNASADKRAERQVLTQCGKQRTAKRGANTMGRQFRARSEQARQQSAKRRCRQVQARTV